MDVVRSPLQVTIAVWKALFLREALTRLFGKRAAWAWLLLEPVLHALIMVMLFIYIRMREVGGIDIAIWLMVGLIAFSMFRHAGTQGMNAIAANRALFTYRQVKPVDTVLVRTVVEGFLALIVGVLLFLAASLIGWPALPDDPILVFEALLGLWMLGVGFALLVSVVLVLIPEVGKILGLIMSPLAIFSGVIFPIHSIPLPYREWLMYNPIPHGLESARYGYANHYYAIPETSISYLYMCALVLLLLGFVFHRRFELQLVSR